MRNLIKFLFLASLVSFTTSIESAVMERRVYIDPIEFSASDQPFHIHIGNNTWIETNNVMSDSTGMYTFERNINTEIAGEYKKTWKCPYCYHYWPIGTKCQNPDCPSKY